MSQYQYERSGNRRRALILVIVASVCLFVAVSTSAHTPLLYIEDNEDGTIYIEGGFSDGSSAAGIPVRMEDADGNTLWKGVLDEFGVVESTLIPEVEPYYVIFDAGPGHVVTKEGIYPSAAVEPEDDAPSNGTQDVPVTPSASATPVVSAPAVTPTVSTAESATLGASGALTPAWMTGTTNAQAGSSADSVLWVIVALLAFIALALLVLCSGVLFFVGWTVGRRGRQV